MPDEPNAPATGTGGTQGTPPGAGSPKTGQGPAQGEQGDQSDTGGGQQDRTDWKRHAREWEAKAKDNAAARKELDDLKAAQMTDAQKMEARAKTAEDRVPALELDNSRLRTALAKGLPADLAGRLQGTTQAELDADADKLLALVGANTGAPRRPADLKQGQRGAAAPAGNSNDWFRDWATGARDNR